MSSIILNIGMTGNGKNHRFEMMAKEYAERKIYVVDPALQYVKNKNFIQINPDENICIPLQRIKDALTNIDEAQIYFPHTNSFRDLVRALGWCRHNNNIIVLNFHAMNQVPKYIINYFNSMILGHTNDREDEPRRWGKLENEIKSAVYRLEKVRTSKPHAAVSIVNI